MTPEETPHTCACGGDCGCQEGHHADQSYLTREEYIERLEHYLVDLKAEINSVEKELADLKQPA